MESDYDNKAIKNGGSDRDRTGYLLVANEALSQMSYGPTGSIIILNARPQSTNIEKFEPLREPTFFKRSYLDSV